MFMLLLDLSHYISICFTETEHCTFWKLVDLSSDKSYSAYINSEFYVPVFKCLLRVTHYNLCEFCEIQRDGKERIYFI